MYYIYKTSVLWEHDCAVLQTRLIDGAQMVQVQRQLCSTNKYRNFLQ